MGERLHRLYAQEGLRAYCCHSRRQKRHGWKHANSLLDGSLLTEADSWFWGANIPGKKRVFLIYANTAPEYRKKCDEVAANGYEGFSLR